MGHDKRFLTVGGIGIFRRTLDVLKKTFAETIVVLAEPVDSLDAQGSKVVYDIVPNAGSLGRPLYRSDDLLRVTCIRSGLRHAVLDAEVIRFMASFDRTADVVVAELEGRFQPMHAMYSQRCLPYLQAMADKQDLKIQRLFLEKQLRVAVLSKSHLTGLASGIGRFRISIRRTTWHGLWHPSMTNRDKSCCAAY